MAIEFLARALALELDEPARNFISASLCRARAVMGDAAAGAQVAAPTFAISDAVSMLDAKLLHMNETGRLPARAREVIS